MPLKGDIQTFSLSAVGRLLHEEKKTGILKVSSGEHETHIYFREGDIVFIRGDLSKELSLGFLLKANCIISEEDLKDSLDTARRKKRRLGAVLMEKGLVTQKELVRMLNNQFKEAIAMVLTWRKGAFVYEDGLKDYVEDIRLEMDPVRLVAEAEKWKAYRSLIPNDGVVFQIKKGALKSNSLSTDGALRVMLLIDGRRDVSQIIAETGLPRLGVYRALAALAVQGAIETEKTSVSFDTEVGPASTVGIRYFMNLIEEITSDIKLDLGERKANTMLERSLKSSGAYALFLDAVKPGENPTQNTRRVCDRLKQGGNVVNREAVEWGFKSSIFQLLKEVHQVLGSKVSQATIGRVIKSKDALPEGQKQVADRTLPFFHALAADERFLTGEKTLSDTSGFTPDAQGCAGPPLKNLERLGGAAIIAFYSQAMQIVAGDLEAEMGTNADALILKVIENSNYSEKFMSQYRVKDDIQANIGRIRDHVAKKGHRLGKTSFIYGFQEVLTAILMEEQLLLGEKATRSTILKMEKRLSNIAQKEYKPLTLHLIMALKRIF